MQNESVQYQMILLGFETVSEILRQFSLVSDLERYFMYFAIASRS